MCCIVDLGFEGRVYSVVAAIIDLLIGLIVPERRDEFRCRFNPQSNEPHGRDRVEDTTPGGAQEPGTNWIETQSIPGSISEQTTIVQVQVRERQNKHNISFTSGFGQL